MDPPECDNGHHGDHGNQTDEERVLHHRSSTLGAGPVQHGAVQVHEP